MTEKKLTYSYYIIDQKITIILTIIKKKFIFKKEYLLLILKTIWTIVDKLVGI